jgi:hypothetical protein
MAEQTLIPLEMIKDQDSRLIAKGVNDIILQNANTHTHCEKTHENVDKRLDAQDVKISNILTKLYWILGALAVGGVTGAGIVKWG